MGKSRTDRNGFTREQRLIQENRILKRHVGALRKELARLSLDKYGNVKEAIEQHYQQDRQQEGQDILDNLKQIWKCHKNECLGYLEIILYNKIDSTFYYRKCTSCSNRTKSQKYTPEVKGIVKNP